MAKKVSIDMYEGAYDGNFFKTEREADDTFLGVFVERQEARICKDMGEHTVDVSKFEFLRQLAWDQQARHALIEILKRYDGHKMIAY